MCVVCVCACVVCACVCACPSLLHATRCLIKSCDFRANKCMCAERFEKIIFTSPYRHQCYMFLKCDLFNILLLFFVLFNKFLK